jgi:hypothetical protein
MGMFLSEIIVKSNKILDELINAFSIGIGKMYNCEYSVVQEEEDFGSFEPGWFQGDRMNVLAIPLGGEWTRIIPDFVANPVDLAKNLAIELRTPILYIQVLDSDQWKYVLYHGGREVDSYLSDPEITGEPPAYGHPKKVVSVFEVQQKEKELADVLQKKYTFAEEGLFDFLTLIGIKCFHTDWPKGTKRYLLTAA